MPSSGKEGQRRLNGRAVKSWEFLTLCITNIDISHVVIRQMQDAHGKDRPNMVYQQMDALNMTFSDCQFSVVLDKGTLDALMPDDSEDVRRKTDKFFNEIDRVLRVGGRYICISLLQEHILATLLEFFPTAGWMFRVCRCIEAEQKSPQSGDGAGLPVFIIVCTKFRKLPSVQPVLEVCLAGEHIQRVASSAEVMSSVKSLQQSSMVCAKLKRGSVAGCGEIFLDLFHPGETTPRYTVHVLDQPYARESGRRFAAFIVPQGRETEWLFATPEGRSTLLKSAGFDRLAVVTLHRDQIYKGLDAVQEELTDSILHLAPPGLDQNTQIPFLSVGSDVGRREICYRGHSQISGDFIVEEVEGDGRQLFRRLIFLNNQGVIQSEARLKLLKSRKGKPKKVVDTGYLACEHHTYMTVGVALAAPDGIECNVAVIGLGGGGLCTFLQHCFQKVRITAVDIDPAMLEVATEYFNLVQDERLDVYIRDGVQFIQQAAEKGTSFHAVLFDVDSKTPGDGMSCPPPQFLVPTLLQDVKKCVGDKGLFILNLVCRSSKLREEAIKNLKAIFKSISSYKLEQEVNEIIFCTDDDIEETQTWRSSLEAAARRVNALAKKRKLHTGELVDVTNLISCLKITA
ncbi:eEF1A lysine and N-terminal methyltransferase homolog isoform X3 [Cryptotermes secundus]|uniref:eEF1A lysine and N-terminal methyltransferase homolog isoform X3 n=1 Tax=Cryptotermes secundus TaxID=105785 RepID=UPI001454C2E3|nr:eEF1A lysine and N-terminal methyltransferase homolog isoform X3 [Cryptotermes secundus]